MIVVSACLCGVNCKYNGLNNKNEDVIEFLKGKEFKIICPEELGGLLTPRIPSEIISLVEETKVINKEGKDVTDEFIRGAEKSLSIAKKYGAKLAILKAKSPSCGRGLIYDGSFSGRLIKGEGITAKLFIKNGIKVLNEYEIKD